MKTTNCYLKAAKSITAVDKTKSYMRYSNRKKQSEYGTGLILFTLQSMEVG